MRLISGTRVGTVMTFLNADSSEKAGREYSVLTIELMALNVWIDGPLPAQTDSVVCAGSD